MQLIKHSYRPFVERKVLFFLLIAPLFFSTVSLAQVATQQKTIRDQKIDSSRITTTCTDDENNCISFMAYYHGWPRAIDIELDLDAEDETLHHSIVEFSSDRQHSYLKYGKTWYFLGNKKLTSTINLQEGYILFQLFKLFDHKATDEPYETLIMQEYLYF